MKKLLTKVLLTIAYPLSLMIAYEEMLNEYYFHYGDDQNRPSLYIWYINN